MSSRQTGSRYMGGKSYVPEPRSSGVGPPPALGALLGLDKMKSGGLTTGSDGKLQFQPYVGKGRQSTINAALLNEQMGGQVMGQQHEKELSAQEAKQTQDLETLKNGLLEHLGKSQQMNAIATKLGIPVDQLAGSIATELASNALKDTKNTGSALDRPDVKQSYGTQLIAGNEAQASKNSAARAITAPMGGVSTIPGLPGQGPTSVKGSTIDETTTQQPTGMINQKTGLPMAVMPVTRRTSTPGSVSYPDNAGAFQNVPPDPNASSPDPNVAPSQQDSPLQTYLTSGMNTNANSPMPQISPGLGQTVSPDNNSLMPSIQQGDQSSIMDYYRQLMQMMQQAVPGTDANTALTDYMR